MVMSARPRRDGLDVDVAMLAETVENLAFSNSVPHRVERMCGREGAARQTVCCQKKKNELITTDDEKYPPSSFTVWTIVIAIVIPVVERLGAMIAIHIAPKVRPTQCGLFAPCSDKHMIS